MKFDVVIVGAGLSGIAAAYHVSRQNPSFTYTILEARDSIGGTWDLFRYPGIRSDSDMYTLGYSFNPWRGNKTIADGASILNYIKETATEFGIAPHIRGGHKVVGAHWSSVEKTWRLDVEAKGVREEISANFVMFCTGYYDYDEGYTPTYPGREEFQGVFIHPQKWNDTIDYAGKKVVVIGSGATAVTMIPELAKKAASVVMLQRSPSYITSLPSRDKIAEKIKTWFSPLTAHKLIRWKNILLSMAVYQVCRHFPNASRKYLTEHVQKKMGEAYDAEAFTPRYDPWDQRLCLVPDADFFKTLRAKAASIVTDTIDSFDSTGIRLASGAHLDADIIVSATGLKLKFLSGLSLDIDGKKVSFADQLPYKSAMLSGIPNLAITIGYTNASWTLKCDLAANWVARLLKKMRENGFTVAIPTANPNVPRVPLIDFSSGYFQRAKDQLPQQSLEDPWRMHQNYFRDLATFRTLDDRDLQLT